MAYDAAGQVNTPSNSSFFQTYKCPIISGALAIGVAAIGIAALASGKVRLPAGSMLFKTGAISICTLGSSVIGTIAGGVIGAWVAVKKFGEDNRGSFIDLNGLVGLAGFGVGGIVGAIGGAAVGALITSSCV